MCAALAELGTGAAAKEVVDMTVFLGVLPAWWDSPTSCLKRRVEPVWPVWFLQEPEPLL